MTETQTEVDRAEEVLADPVSRVLAAAAAVVALAMMLHISVNALSRTFLGNPLTGTLEYTQYWYLPSIALAGIAAAQRTGGHIEARLLFDNLPSAARPAVQVATDLLTLALAVAVTVYSAQMALESMEMGRTAGVVGVVVWPATFVVPICFGLFAVWLARDVVGVLAAWRERRPDAEVR